MLFHFARLNARAAGAAGPAFRTQVETVVILAETRWPPGKSIGSTQAMP